MGDMYIFLYMFFLKDMGYHWTDYARCQFPESGYECIVSQDEMKVLNFLLDKANENTPCYENRFYLIDIDKDSCPKELG